MPEAPRRARATTRDRLPGGQQAVRDLASGIWHLASDTPLLPKRLLIPWAIFLALAVVATLGVGVQRADYVTPFALAGMYGLVAGAELLVLLVVTPLASGEGQGVGTPAVVLLWAMAAPVVVVAWWVSDVDAASVAASQGYLLAVALGVAGYLRADRGGRFRSWYWLLVGLLGAGVPVAAFVVGDHLRSQLTWLYALSPFWVLARIAGPWQFGWDWAAPFAGVVCVATALWLVSRIPPLLPPSRLHQPDEDVFERW